MHILDLSVLGLFSLPFLFCLAGQGARHPQAKLWRRLLASGSADGRKGGRHGGERKKLVPYTASGGFSCTDSIFFLVGQICPDASFGWLPPIPQCLLVSWLGPFLPLLLYIPAVVHLGVARWFVCLLSDSFT